MFLEYSDCKGRRMLLELLLILCYFLSHSKSVIFVVSKLEIV